MGRFHIMGELTYSMVSELDKEIRNSDPKDFFGIVINSVGGEVYVGLALYDLIKSYQDIIHFQSHGFGIVASSATLPYMACQTRFAYEHTSFIFHTPCVDGLTAQPDDLKARANQLHKLTHMQNKIAGEYGIKLQDIDHVIYSPEALVIGLANDIA